MPKKNKAKVEMLRKERDWVLETQEAGKITSMEMQFFVDRMGAQLLFNVPEVAEILGTTANSIYALCEEGKLNYINRGSRKKHYYIFPRPALMRFLQQRCNMVEK